MNYFKLLQFFCIKYRITLPVSQSGNNIPTWQQGLEERLKAFLTEDQYAVIKAILDDNAELIGKSTFFDESTFTLVKNRHVERLQALKYSPEEIEQCLPNCLKGEKFPSLKDSIIRGIIDEKEPLLPEEEISSLSVDVVGDLNELKKERKLTIKTSKLFEFGVQQLTSLIEIVNDKNLSESDPKKLGCVVAYGSREDVEDAFQNDREILNKHQVPTNATSSWFMTYLQLTVQSNNFINFACLLDLGADPTLLDRQNSNLWHHVFNAADLFFIESLFRLDHEKNLSLIEKIDVNAKNRNGYTPLHFAAQKGCLEQVKLLFSKQFSPSIALNEKEGRKGDTPLHIAVEQGDEDFVKFLILVGVDLSATDNSGRTALHCAIYRGDLALVKLLTEQGADLNSVVVENGKNFNALFVALVQRKYEIAEFLVKAGDIADLEIKNGGSITALVYAISLGKEKLAKLLVKKGANVNVVLPNGETPLHIATRLGKKDLVKFLITYGAKDSFNGQGQTILEIALEQDESEIVQLLIEKGDSINVPDQKGNTLLHRAINNGQTELAKFFIEQGAKLNVVNKQGNTALHLALMNRNDELAKLLIEQGANIFVRNNRGLSSLDFISGKVKLLTQGNWVPHPKLFNLEPVKKDIPWWLQVERNVSSRIRIAIMTPLILNNVLMYLLAVTVVMLASTVAFTGANFLVPLILTLMLILCVGVLVDCVAGLLLKIPPRYHYYAVIDAAKAVGHFFISCFYFLKQYISSQEKIKVLQTNSYQSLNVLLDENEEGEEMEEIISSDLQSEEDGEMPLIPRRRKNMDKEEEVEAPDERDEQEEDNGAGVRLEMTV